MGMNKKAIFFTLLALAILSLFIASYAISSIAKNREGIQKRVATLNSFVYSMEQDLPRQLYVSGFRIIFLFQKEITEKGQYIDDVQERFEEIFFNRTFNGESDEELQTLMGGASYYDIINNFQMAADKINTNAHITNPELTVSQDNPWTVKVMLTVDFFVEDDNKLASWSKRAEIISYIPVESFEDPFYTIGTKGKVSNKIKKTVFYPFSDGNVNLTLHVNSSMYISSSDAPSFLDRLEGKNIPDTNGIESLVYLPRLSSQNLPIEVKSVVDHIYFSSNNPVSYEITGMPSWFRLDDAHLETYQVTKKI